MSPQIEQTRKRKIRMKYIRKAWEERIRRGVHLLDDPGPSGAFGSRHYDEHRETTGPQAMETLRATSQLHLGHNSVPKPCCHGFHHSLRMRPLAGRILPWRDNEVVNSWRANPSFHHHPDAIVALWLLLFIARAVFHCSVSCNLKPLLRD